MPITEADLAGPKPAKSLLSRGAPLASTAAQLEALRRLPLEKTAHGGDFDKAAAAAGHAPLRPGALEIFQINVGKLCNMTCRHCHVDAGPDRTRENMSRETVDDCLR